VKHFDLPPPLPETKVKHEDSMLEHLKKHWVNLVRSPQKTTETSSLIQLPHPYVVPGGRFREMFYWDSFFTIVGLLGSDEDELALGMIDNFAFLVEQYGYVPNGNRSYFLSRSQPPFFAAMVNAYGEKHGLESVEKYLPHLEKEYLFWMDHHATIPSSPKQGKHLIVLENGDYLNRYYGSRDFARAEAFGKETRWAEFVKPAERGTFFRNLRAVCESGWDFSSRWYADGMNKSTIHAMDIVPVDLNSLLYILENTIAQLHAHKNNTAKATVYQERATTRKALIHRYHYDEATGTYQDYDLKNKRHTGRLSLAMAYPLFAGAADPKVAPKIAQALEKNFLKPGGLVSTLTQSGEQWDFPNGWAPLQYISVKGLLGYQENGLAMEVAKRWLALNERVYKEEGKMMEKYNVVDPAVKAGGGEYPNQDGFGWTNGVNIAFYDLLAREAKTSDK